MRHVKSLSLLPALVSFMLFVFCASRFTALTAQEPGGPQEPPNEQPKPQDEKPKELTKEEAKAKLDAFKKAYTAAVKDEHARVQALDALEGALHPDIMALLGEVLTSDPSDTVRETAAYALGSMKDKRAVPFLDEGIIANKNKYTIWVTIFDALGEIADPKTSTLVLAKFLQVNTAILTKEMAPCISSAIENLAGIRHISTIEELVKCYECLPIRVLNDQEKELWTRYSAKYNWALQKLTGESFIQPEDWSAWWRKNGKDFSFEKGKEPKPAKEEKETKEPAKEEAKAKLDAFKKAYSAAMKDDRARVEAVKALEGLVHPDIIAILGNVLISDNADNVREAAAYALGSMKDKRAVPFLDKGIQPNNKKYDIWVAILDALGETADSKTATPVLVKFLQMHTAIPVEEMVPCIGSATESLAGIRHISSIEGLVKCYEHLPSGEAWDGLDEEGKRNWSRYGGKYNLALCKLTGESFDGGPKEWRIWWNKNRKVFSFEKKDKK